LLVNELTEKAIAEAHRRKIDTYNGRAEVQANENGVIWSNFDDQSDLLFKNSYMVEIIADFSVNTDYDTDVLLDGCEDLFLRDGYFYDFEEDEYYTINEVGERIEAEVWEACNEDRALENYWDIYSYPISSSDVLDEDKVDRAYQNYVNHHINLLQDDDEFDSADFEKIGTIKDYLNEDSLNHLNSLQSYKKNMSMFL
jgi:hypothetical protein